MLRLETHKEGFSLDFKGRPLILHSHAAPCLHVSELPPIQWVDQGRGEGRWVRKAFRRTRGLKDYRILENLPERIVLNFEGRLGLELAVEDGLLSISFAASQTSEGLRIDFACRPGEAIFGGGVDSRALVDVARSRIEAWGSEASYAGLESIFRRPVPGRDWPLMSFVTEEHRWFRVEGQGWMAADFRTKGRFSFEFSLPPASIVVGAEEDLARAIAALGRRSGPSLEPPAWTRSGPIVATRAHREGFAELLSRLEMAGIHPAGIRLADHDILDPSSSRDERVDILRSRGLRVLAVARPGRELAASIDSGAGGEGRLAELLGGHRFSGIRIEAAGFLTASNPQTENTRQDEAVSVRHSRLSRALLESGCPPRAAGSKGEGKEGFLLSSAKGWGMAAAMHACALPAIVDEVSLVPRRMSAFLAHGLSGGGWAWLDASSPQRFQGTRKAKAATSGLSWRRAIELAAFGPVFEFENADEDEEVLRFLARMSAVYSALGPYHEAVASEYRSALLPPIRHSLLHYESGLDAQRGSSQYLYGRDLLVAVSGKASDFVTLDLPDDDWIHLWSSRHFRGGAVSIEAPAGHPAVFYRAASPFASLFDSVRRETRRK
ncbi:MAG TPA: hypothetical protein VMV44_07130 [Rectinemataceae bacterium]|nr:hypothetical protein [Rectinemataceae bacterium]